MCEHQRQVQNWMLWIGVITATLLAIFRPGDCKAEKPIPVESALPIIEALEGRIRVARWRTEGINGKLLDSNNVDNIEVPPDMRGYYTKWQAWFEPQSGRYRADMESVAGWTDGTEPSGAAVESFSNDNQTERCYRRFMPGRKVPPQREGAQNGKVIYPQANAFMDHYGFSAGMYFIPPYFYGRRFSDYLRTRIEKKQPLTIRQDEKGLWQIETVPLPLEANYSGHSKIRLTYDSSRGIMLGAEWIGTPDAPLSANKTWARCVLKWAQADGGVWVPTAHYYHNLLDQKATRLTYHDMRVNQSVDDSVFRITFPPGTHVTDEVEKKIYRASTGIIDEQQAIRDFMEWEKLRDQPPLSKSHYMAWIIFIGGLVLIAPVLVWWRKRKRVAPKLLLLVGVFVAPAVRAADLDGAGNWTVSHGPGESMRISQCGLNVTIFTLEYFHVSYRVKQVAAGLPPDEKGIRFSDIKTMLESHGLDVSARAKVSLAELKRVLKSGFLAIFPVRKTEQENHYLIALRHSNRGLVMIDPPVQVRPFEEAIREKDLAALGGILLFVRKPPDTEPKQASRVAIDPERIEIGRFCIDDPSTSKPLIKHIKILNASEKAVLISQVLTACGCLNTKWKGGVLAAGESCDLPATIALGGWVAGKVSQRDLSLVFADGSVRRIAFVADIVSAVRPKHLHLRPDFLNIDLADEPSTVARQVRVVLDDSKSNRLSITSHPAWLQVNLKPVGEGEALLILRLVPEAIPGEERVKGEVRIGCSSDDPEVKLPIVLNRRMRYRLEPPIVHFSAGSTQEQVVLLTPLQMNDPVPEGLSVLSAPKELQVTRSDKGNKIIQLRLSLTATLPAGCYLVQCCLGSNRQQEPALRLLVHVSEQDGH